MIRKFAFAWLVAFTVAGSPVAAQSMQETIVDQLVDQGFGKIRISTTLLGRTRIVATSPSKSREIIFNPRTGEILRDYWDDLDDDDHGVRLVSPSDGSSGGSMTTGDDDDGARNTGFTKGFFDEFTHFAAAFADQADDDGVAGGFARQHGQQHRLPHAGTGENAEALPAAAGGEDVHRAHAEVETLAYAGARMGRRRGGLERITDPALG